MGRGATPDSESGRLVLAREQGTVRALRDLADSLRATLEARPGMRLYHAFAWLLLEAEARGHDGLSAMEVAEVFDSIDPGLYGQSERTRYQHLLSNATKMELTTTERLGSSTARWHPTLYAREYLSKA